MVLADEKNIEGRLWPLGTRSRDGLFPFLQLEPPSLAHGNFHGHLLPTAPFRPPADLLELSERTHRRASSSIARSGTVRWTVWAEAREYCKFRLMEYVRWVRIFFNTPQFHLVSPDAISTEVKRSGRAHEGGALGSK